MGGWEGEDWRTFAAVAVRCRRLVLVKRLATAFGCFPFAQ